MMTGDAYINFYLVVGTLASKLGWGVMDSILDPDAASNSKRLTATVISSRAWHQ